MAKIDLSNISHTYNPLDPKPTYALNPFSMTWENGKRYAILGPSGCGKTTMLNIVSGLVRPSKGEILFDETPVTDLKTEDRNILNFSIFRENTTPRITPESVAKKPIVKPVKKKVFLIDLLLKPRVFNIAISLVLFLINIVKPEIILKAATIIINVKIINMTFLSTFKALKKDLFKSAQV